MALEAPRLDDRAFKDLVSEARQRITLYCPEWTDHNLSDPGITLIELFAWMTDIVLYRLNRVPDKHYIKFMELIGIRVEEAEAARVPVTFWLTAPQPDTFKINAGTEVATPRTDDEPAIVFSTDRTAEILVPHLTYLLTSRESSDGRVFEQHNVSTLQSGLMGVRIFSSAPPANDDAVYFGFEQDLSHHIVGFYLEVDRAEGAGIDPKNPPYVWETLMTGANQNWVPVEIDDDSTQGLNVNGWVKVFLPGLRRAERDGITAYWLRCRLNVKEGQTSYEVSPTLRGAEVSGWGITVDTTNITQVKGEVLGRSDGSPGQVFYLEHTPIVPRTGQEYLMVRTPDDKEERWYEVSDFSTSSTDDRHYTVDSQTGELRLGPALRQRDGQMKRYGAIPAQGSMLVMVGYRYGGGMIGNVANNTLRVLKTAIPYIAKVANRVAAAGGLDAETLENAKMRVPGHLRSLRRAVTAADYEYLTQEAVPGAVGRVHCLQPPQTSRGEVRLLVIPRVPRLAGFIPPEALTLSEEVRETILRYLDERRLLSTLLDVTNPAYQWVETEINYRSNPNADIETVQRAIENRLFEFLNPLIGGHDGKGWHIGRDIFVGDILSVLLAIPGVDFIRSVKLFPADYVNGEFIRGEAIQEIPMVAHGVAASYRHVVRDERRKDLRA
jgi:predicted phage baseplate assembly protein